MASDHRIPPPDVVASVLLEKIDFFTEVQLWPLTQNLDAAGWLTNFRTDELDHAHALLNAFVFISEPIADALLRAAFQSLSADFVSQTPTYQHAVDTWREACRSLLITYVQGEEPHVTDSGLTFVRKARRILGLGEDQIGAPDAILARALLNPRRPVLFLDDFVGSGNQMRDTWRRKVSLNGEEWSFGRLASEKKSLCLYAPLVCTSHGRGRLERSCPELVLRPAHCLDERYGALHQQSILWPVPLRAGARAFVDNTSTRAGIVRELGTGGGFHGLGLALGFWDSVPDATLPLFWWERNGWIPLVRRR